jgi:Protein of unknown function (DUF2480)
MEETIINRVSESLLTTLDLEEFYPRQPIAVFDLKGYLYMELILKEKDFRAALLATDWSQYAQKAVAVTCSANAIIPVWAYMLVASYLQPVATDVVLGDEKQLHEYLFRKNLAAIDVTAYTDKRVVIKGCGETPIGEFAYLEITRLLRPVVKSIMYGEPCSTVPVFKRKA